ncbi:MAG: hypothetical protein IPK17_09330 [Chloroflexi bacterium]|uniref:hypothetical protein n=1 Tax=Candidatus Flexifilum breve TaxID=3140694 RepID=UPI00313583CC|nr:hypothetical protein [Chloroflexota bacterium]
MNTTLTSSDPVNRPPVADASGLKAFPAKNTRLTTAASAKCTPMNAIKILRCVLRMLNVIPEMAKRGEAPCFASRILPQL